MFEIVSTTDSHHWLKKCRYELCKSVDQLREVLSIENCRKAKFVGSDLETDSRNVEKARIVCLSFSTDEGHGLMVPVAHKVGSEFNLPLQEVIDHLKMLDDLGGFSFVWWYYKYDSEVLARRHGVDLKNWDDGMIADYLDNPNLNEYGLKKVIQRRYGIEPLEFTETVKGRTWDLIHPTDGVDYACQDADFARRIFLLPSVQAAVKEQEFIYKLEKMVCPEIREGESNKVILSLPKLRELKADCDRRVGPLLHEIFELAGGEFKLDSPAVLGPKLIALGVPITEVTGKTKQPSTKKEILEKYQHFHAIVPKIIQFKELTTQARNYIDKMIAAVEYFGPAIRFPFHQVGVPTGRMKAGGEGDLEEAYDKGVAPVNAQSIPDPEKKPYLPNIRSAIVANVPRETISWSFQNMTIPGEPAREISAKFRDEGDFVIVAADYSQVELRIAANMSREPAWIKTFSEGGDIHLTNAQLAYRDYKMQKSDKRRKRGKTMSFAILYGGDENTVANHGGIPIEQAKALVDNFFGGARTLKAWIDSWIKMAEQQKFVKTYFGRKRPLDEYYAKDAPRWLRRKGGREAVNDPIQGGAADVFKLGMVKLGKMIRANNWQNDCQQTMWIHDEFVLRVRRSMIDQIVPEIFKTLEFDVKGWPVKIKIDVEVGWNWGEMIPWDAYKILGPVGISHFVPWGANEETYAAEGIGIIESLTVKEEEEPEPEEEETPLVLDRSEYGY